MVELFEVHPEINPYAHAPQFGHLRYLTLHYAVDSSFDEIVEEQIF